MDNYFERARELAPELVKTRRTIHQNPEIGMDVPKTSKYVFDQLVQLGYEPRYIGGTGVTATVGRPGKTILLRGDMDALPINEESGLPFASQNPGAAHCCGHDLHTAMLLGAAKLLKENEAQLKGTVKFMFQPGEEVLMGARAMLDDGILENPQVDAAMGIHVNSMVPPLHPATPLPSPSTERAVTEAVHMRASIPSPSSATSIRRFSSSRRESWRPVRSVWSLSAVFMREQSTMRSPVRL